MLARSSGYLLRVFLISYFWSKLASYGFGQIATLASQILAQLPRWHHSPTTPLADWTLFQSGMKGYQPLLVTLVLPRGRGLRGFDC